MNLSIVLPSYQEAENLKKLLPLVNEKFRNKEITYEVIVVDTVNKMDDTFLVCNNNNCKYVPREGGNTYGDAIRTGFLKANGEYIVVMDADGSHNPNDIYRLYAEITRYNFDVIIASRYCKGGGTNNNVILISMSKILNFVYRIFFSIKVSDLSNSFRIYKGTQIKSLELECDNFDIVEEILIKLFYQNKSLQIGEIPTVFNKRDKGVSKRHLISFIFSYIFTMNRLLKIKYKLIKKENN